MPTMKWYGLGLEAAMEQASDSDYLTGTVKVALTTASYTPNQDTHQFFSDITNEVSGTGYTAGGATLTSKTITYDATTQRIWLNAADVTWATSTITNARYAIIYIDTGVAGTSRLLAYLDMDSNQSTSASDFQIQWATNDILYIDVT